MIAYIQRYGEQRTRNTVIAALYIATGRVGRRPFVAAEIREVALELIRVSGEDGSISTETVKRVLEPINGEVLEFADRNRGLYQLKDISMRKGLF